MADYGNFNGNYGRGFGGSQPQQTGFQGNAYAEENQALSWDGGSYTPKDSFVTIEPGIYQYTISKLEKGRHEGSPKLPPCPKASLTLDIVYKGDTVSVIDNIFMIKKNMGYIGRLFESAGFPVDANGNVQVDWNTIVGRSGYCEIKNRQYQGNTYNDVKRYISPNDMQTLGTAPAQQPAAGGFNSSGFGGFSGAKF